MGAAARSLVTERLPLALNSIPAQGADGRAGATTEGTRVPASRALANLEVTSKESPYPYSVRSTGTDIRTLPRLCHLPSQDDPPRAVHPMPPISLSSFIPSLASSLTSLPHNNSSPRFLSAWTLVAPQEHQPLGLASLSLPLTF